MNLQIIFSTNKKPDLPKAASAALLTQEKLGLFDTKKGGLFVHLDATGATALKYFGTKELPGREAVQHEAAETLRALAGKLSGAKKVTITFTIEKSLTDLAEPIEMGLLLAARAYAGDTFKSKKEKLAIEIRGTKKELVTIADAVETARRLVSTPANILDTSAFLREAKTLARRDTKLKILRKKELQKEKMGMHLAVAAGSKDEPALIVVDYAPAGTTKDEPIVLVGKGLIYDSGGYGIKPGDYMADMYADMGGAATVLAVISALQKLGVQRRVVGLMAMAENMINEKAMKSGDILTSKKGLTVEVEHTDAEGRLVLGDALTFAAEKWPKYRAIVDIATLTGGCVYAAGEMYTGLFTDSEELKTSFVAAGERENDWMFPLPFDEIIKKSVDGTRSDVRNLSSIQRSLGHSTAAAFLARFVPDTKKWVHLDVAGTAMRRQMRRGYDHKHLYGSGGAVRTLIRIIREMKK